MDKKAEYSTKGRRGVIRETGELQKCRVPEIKVGAASSRKEVVNSVKCSKIGGD